MKSRHSLVENQETFSKQMQICPNQPLGYFPGGKPLVLLRQEIGDVLRAHRLRRGQTLRQVAAKASVALGYLSEVERGQKEVSSEILASVADALEVPLSVVMREVSDRVASVEGIYLDDTYIPDTVPDAFITEAGLYSQSKF
jgi:transcriptional regulator with XRE-family HTH domain